MSNTNRSILPFMAICIVGGLFINVVVAVICTIFAQHWPRPATNLAQSGGGDRLRDLRTTYHSSNALHFGCLGFDASSLGYRELTFLSHATTPTEKKSPFETFLIIEIEAGWPLPVLRRIKRTDMDNIQWISTASSFTLAPRVASADAEWYIIPTEPVWKGFVLNSLFYAVALAVIFAGPGLVRRQHRSRRGLCQRCAYPIGVSDRCSECGEPIPPNARRLTERAISKT